MIESYMGFSGYLLCDLTSRELMCHIIGQIDKANGYFEQPEKVKNARESAIDYQAIEMYVSTEAVQELYDKYIDCDTPVPGQSSQEGAEKDQENGDKSN